MAEAPEKNDAPVDPGAGEVPTTAAGTNVIKDLEKRLTNEHQGQGQSEQGVDSTTPAPIDLSNLTQEQLQTLKAQLAVTPEAPVLHKKNPTVLIRKIEGKYVVWVGRAWLALVRDPELRADVERHMISFRLEGEQKDREMLYTAFRQAERVECEITASREDVTEKKEGLVRSKETGLLIERVARMVTYFFTIKTPEGRTFEVPGDVVN